MPSSNGRDTPTRFQTKTASCPRDRISPSFGAAKASIVCADIDGVFFPEFSGGTFLAFSPWCFVRNHSATHWSLWSQTLALGAPGRLAANRPPRCRDRHYGRNIFRRPEYVSHLPSAVDYLCCGLSLMTGCCMAVFFSAILASFWYSTGFSTWLDTSSANTFRADLK